MELNKIYNMDCVEGMKQLEDKSISMILSDLPYQVTGMKWDTLIPFGLLWEQYERVIKDDGAIVLTSQQPFTTELINSNRKLYKYNWVWVKNTASGIALAKKQPMRYSEDICVFYKKQPTYNPQMIPRTEESKKRCQYEVINGGNGGHIELERRKTKYDPNMKYPSNVIYFNSVPNSKGKLHNTQKPVELFEYLIKTYTTENAIILDSCMGSGTTAIATLRLGEGRKFIGFEIEKVFYDIANKRIEDEIVTA